ncbi:MAG TPA: zeta toxin family protein [Methanocorpusculum sp.]|nr:zeta toxin family protein [Methanocorpusculum sp.]
MKFFIIFAGPNGSGKSSLKSSLGRTYPLFVNRGISLDAVQYINADFCARTNPVVSQMPAGFEKDKAAWEATERWRNSALESGDNIIWETVFSDKRRLDEIEKARALGYYIIVIYVTTLSPDINIERIKCRVKSGGHGVPEDKIISRYHKATNLLPEIILAADDVIVYDNSSEYPVQTFYKLEKGHTILPFSKPPKTDCFIASKTDIGNERYTWVLEHILNPLKERGYAVCELPARREF